MRGAAEDGLQPTLGVPVLLFRPASAAAVDRRRGLVGGVRAGAAAERVAAGALPAGWTCRRREVRRRRERDGAGPGSRRHLCVLRATVPGHHARYQPLATVACTELPSLRSTVTAVTPHRLARRPASTRSRCVSRATAAGLDLTRGDADGLRRAGTRGHRDAVAAEADFAGSRARVDRGRIRTA